MSLKQEFLDRMKNLLGNKFDCFCEKLNEPIQKAIFVNENKMPVEKFAKIVDFPIEPIEYERAGFYVDSEKKGRHALHHAGAFYIQEPSAMFTVNSIKFSGDEKVLDMCASPGGKSIQIANRITNGVLVSNEINPARCETLVSNIERMGLKNVVITCDKPEKIGKAYANYFDVCLVDAPCSGEGMFRRGDEVSSQWNSGLEDLCQQRQLEILEHANKTLKQNGILIYSTCTYSQKENEDVVTLFMQKHNYQLQDISYPNSRGIGLPQAVRLYPHENKGEGQFVAVLKKIEENEEIGSSVLKLQKSKFAKDFLQTNTNLSCDVFELKNNCFIVRDLSSLKKDVNYMRIGVKVGEMKNKRFEPDHNLFSAFGLNFKNKLELDFKDENVKKYLHGDAFEVEIEDGYGSIIVNGCSLGGFKVVNGVLKNHYHKGLRNFKI